MRPATMLLMFPLSFAGCSSDGLTPLPDDGGSTKDAGPVVTRDAGTDDAGGVGDAGGNLDSGPSAEIDCQWDAPIPPFECEDDADFCDVVGDALPGKDILAGWSRVEGDRVFIQIRFASWPFPPRDDSQSVNFDAWAHSVTAELFILFGDRSEETLPPPWAPRLSFCEPSDHTWCVDGVRYMTLAEAGLPALAEGGGIGCNLYGFPPEAMWTSARDRGTHQAFSIVDRVKMSTTVPLLQLELDAANVIPSNGILTWAVLNDLQGSDTSLSVESPGVALSKNGMADESDTLVPAYEWTCPGVNPRPSVASAACAGGAAGVCAPDGSAWTCVDGEPRFERWCQNLSRSTCAVFEENDGGGVAATSDSRGARCVVGQFPEPCTELGLMPWCSWAGHHELCGVGAEIEGWGCEVREFGGGGCTFGVAACTDEQSASVPFCDGDLRVESCHPIGNQPTFADCSTWFPGGTCVDGACVGIGYGWPCDGVGFLCDEGLVCDINEGATMGDCFPPQVIDAGQ
jgi:hypothetical protein